MRTLHRLASTLNPSSFVFSFLLAFVAVSGSVPMLAQQEHYPTQPTPEELSMTSQPQAPGAAAVYLYREERFDDTLGQHSYYFRVKVLTEAGRERANVRVGGFSDTNSESYSFFEAGVVVTGIEGRTIHSDGTVIPFTGKPYERAVEKSKGFMETETVFTLPDVQVGSILEYHFNASSINGGGLFQPTWYVQQNLYTRKAVYSWKVPDYDDVFDEDTGQSMLGVSYTTTLPAGLSVQSTAVPSGGAEHAYHRFDLTVHDIPPIPEEEYMPPLSSSIYRVNFFYSFTRNQAQYWQEAGKGMAKNREHFIGDTESIRSAADSLVGTGDTDTVKLQKIYAAIMAMDNTSFSREHEKKEDKAAGLKEVKSVQDIWQRKRGNDDQLTLLFIALARAAGMKAYDMRVTDRDTNLFSPAVLTTRQLDDDIAIVVLDGKEQFFDPGQRECPFGQMAWKHTGTSGIRETEDGTTAIAATPEPPYTESAIQRIADLTMSADGTATGTLQVMWTGAPALYWRQQAVLEDEVAVKHEMSNWMDGLVPSGMKAELTSVDNLSAYEKPLVANFKIDGPLATVTAKRLILPSQFFEVNSKPLFPQPTRDIQIYFNHTGKYADAMRVKFPADIQVESAPKDDAFALQKLATYHTIPLVQPGVVLMRRSYVLGTAFFNVPEYGDVKSFYDKMAADDQQPVVLINASAATGTKAAQ